MLVELNEQNFEENTKTGLKLVEFYTKWCGYCQKQRPIIEELAKNYVWIGTVEADENPNLATNFQIAGFPTFLLFKDGKIISRLQGYHDKSLLLSRLIDKLN